MFSNRKTKIKKLEAELQNIKDDIRELESYMRAESTLDCPGRFHVIGHRLRFLVKKHRIE